MEQIYKKHKNNIISIFHNDDIDIILSDSLKSNFDSDALFRISESRNEKVKVFFEEFDKILSVVKYTNFIHSTLDISEWISAFLISEDDGQSALRKFTTSLNLINRNCEFVIDNFEFNSSVVADSLQDELITKQTSSMLLKMLKIDGEIVAKYRFYSLLHVHSIQCYQKFILLCLKHCPVYLELFHVDLYNSILEAGDSVERHAYISAFTTSEIDNFTDDLPLSSIMSSTSSLGNMTSGPPSFNSYQRKTLSVGSDDSSDENLSEDIEYDAIFGEIKDKPICQIVNLFPDTDASNIEEKSLEMREYQKELATNGIEGKNVLICAPTSSGKTIVAIRIAEDHMSMDKRHKVAMVVPTTVLVDQQYRQFRRFLGKKLKINKLSGGSKSLNVPLSKQVKDYDIFVFTCDILKNALEDAEDGLKSISEFSLIIFDECHHTDKEHSYNKVMDHYFMDLELDKKVPQIIGMTASTGTDKAKNVEAALNSLISLCANLDCHTVSTVAKNIEELKKVLPSPLNELKPVSRRNVDKFETNLITLIETTERTLQSIFRPKNKPIGIPTDRYHDKYLSFVKGITNYFPNLLTEEEEKAVKIIEIYLENFYRALLINHLFTCSHARDMLMEKIDTKAPCTCDVELDLRGHLKKFLSSVDLQQDDNPSLELLKEEMRSQMKSDKMSKIIVFVKEVLYTRILEKEIKQAKLGFVQCQALVGTNKGADQGGLSKSETEVIVARFRDGVINVLFATSVAEEGLDVEKCNLVIRYGHVTNEIAMVQSRGRARALISKYLVIVPHELRWQINKENVNKVRETMMYKAIEEFQRMDLNTLNKKISDCQDKRQDLRRGASCSSTRESLARSVDKNDWAFHCGKCGEYICSSKDIRLANGTSYINVNKWTYDFLKVNTTTQNNIPCACKNCDQQLGYIIKVENIKVPVIHIKQVSIKNGEVRMKKKKWKDVPFKVPEVQGHELMECHGDHFTKIHN